MDTKRYSIGKLISKLGELGYEIDAPTLKRLEEKGVIDSPERILRGECREDRHYSDDDLYEIIRDLEWYYGLRSSAKDTLLLKKAWELQEGLIKKLHSDSLEEVRAAEIFIRKNREELTRLVLEELQSWEVAKRGARLHLEFRKKALKQMNELIRSLRDKRNGFGLLKQKLWECTRIEAERVIMERIQSSPGIRQCELYEGYEEFTNWITPMLADWDRKGLIKRAKEGRTYRVFCAKEPTKASA
jgi:hypothetical protein